MMGVGLSAILLIFKGKTGDALLRGTTLLKDYSFD
jgi:hypothetical protein